MFLRVDFRAADASAGAPRRASGGAAVLLLMSGEPRQAILTWLSNHVVDVPPLPTEALRTAVAFALETHFEGTVERVPMCSSVVLGTCHDKIL